MTVLGQAGRTRSRWEGVAALVLVVALLLVPFMVTSSIMFRVGAAVTAALLALSLNLLFGTTGLISFGHAAFFALGGYAIGLALDAGLSWPLALLLACLTGPVVGGLFSTVALRASGIFFAILTLGLGEIIRIILLQWTEVTGGDNGLSGISAGTWLGLDLTDPVVYYWVLVVVASLGAAALRMITYSRFGRTLNAIREDDVRAAYLGVPVKRYRAASFTISAGFASLAGALFAPLVGLMVPANAGWARSAEPILATLLGGVNSFFGPVLGSGLFATLDYLARDLESWRIVFTGALLLLVILVAPGGVMGAVRSLLDRRRKPATESDPGAAVAPTGEGVSR
ncbi:amino acid/amide ABC transporter membrane protein 2 (HAAT family) [Blastococcus colisei]|uniref:Amino acid/amide ABC transporter membrane protein 2 (HAAT family) n=1 Tax=Blastococcus colisei TaxID=1564162 RepID=A0A543PFG2_9ACTN|nr:branched-chain amino acid ABC transporter permease [Blastococcus colisei]TQN42806.1 amino acid/amide ABC transporter membrane protein 2 (HAAT family) [Blastococcus colisei]